MPRGKAQKGRVFSDYVKSGPRHKKYKLMCGHVLHFTLLRSIYCYQKHERDGSLIKCVFVQFLLLHIIFVHNYICDRLC